MNRSLGDAPILCILHGDPTIPAWMRAPSVTHRLHLTVNDPATGRYGALPAAASVRVNDRPLGFAANANTGLGRLFVDHEVVFCTNFDLDLDPAIFEVLERAARQPRTALVAPILCGSKGQPVFSAGAFPTPLKEFTRAAGLRGGRPQRLVRSALRRHRGWQLRNSPRDLGRAEYLPWTLVAVHLSAWQDVGPLDERFPMYAEDIDWGLRSSELGWTSRLVDAGRVVHDERRTASPRTNALYELSHARLHAKHGWVANAAWQRRGLTLRRTVLRPFTEPVDWDEIDLAEEAHRAAI